MTRLLEQWAADADLVVIDAPPLLPVADTQVLLDEPRVDAYLIVGRDHFTKRDDARSTAQLLEPRKLRGVGLVVNGVRRLAGGTSYYSATGSSSAGVANGRPADRLRAR
jgi:succinoglycan biosynthesis transport protein ExoP